jgi:hypothetical protein
MDPVGPGIKNHCTGEGQQQFKSQSDDSYEIMQISDYYSNDISTVNTLHEFKLYSTSGMRKQSSVSVYRVYYVNFDNILIWICEVLAFQGRSSIVSLIIMRSIVNK